MPRKVLVGQAPAMVKLGVWLTDGVDNYEVRDTHYRDGEPWFELLNLTSPELEARAWFRLEDLHELAFYRNPGPTQRRYGVRKGPR